MGSSEEGRGRGLGYTPTWVVASVCTVLILISLILEKCLRKVGTWLGERHKKALLQVLENLKAELMILGFISLLLTFAKKNIVERCIPANVANKMLPCYMLSNEEEELYREFLSYERTHLSENSSKCKEEGYEPLISAFGLHELHIFIFFFAVLHVLYSAVTMFLGRLKIRGWKAWEEETSTHGFANDSSRIRLTRETSFVK